MFIVIHQVYELWFKELLSSWSPPALSSRRATRAGEASPDRVHTIERVLVEQVAVLESMSPRDFLEFRAHLAPASGFQSLQFREIEFLSGLKDEEYVRRLDLDAEQERRLRARLDEPTLWDAFCGYLGARGLPMPADDLETRRASLVQMASEPDKWAESTRCRRPS